MTRIAIACGPELVERAVAVLAHVEVDLRDGVDAEVGDEVDEQADLDAPALDERHRLEQRAPAGVLTGERLHEPREVREQRRDDRPGHELGDPPAAGGLAVQRAAVVALHEADRGIGEQRLRRSRVTKCEPKLRTSASSQQTMSPSHA